VSYGCGGKPAAIPRIWLLGESVHGWLLPLIESPINKEDL